MPSRCPPGVFCLSEGMGQALIALFVIALVVIGVILMRSHPTIILPSAPASAPAAAQQTIVNAGGDSRYERAPQPLRSWRSEPEFPPRGGLTSLPFNIPTQGLPDAFQSVGVINVGEQMLPLYGRRTAGSSDRWNYYTRTDTYNPVPIPVHFQRRDCMDGTGCQEVMSGETVRVAAMGKEGKTHLYKMDGPTYLPGVL